MGTGMPITLLLEVCMCRQLDVLKAAETRRHLVANQAGSGWLLLVGLHIKGFTHRFAICNQAEPRTFMTMSPSGLQVTTSVMQLCMSLQIRILCQRGHGKTTGSGQPWQASVRVRHVCTTVRPLASVLAAHRSSAWANVAASQGTH